LVGSEEDFHLFDEKENKFQAKKYFEGKEYKYRSHSILKRNKEYYIANWGLQKFNPNALIGRRVEVVADSELRNEFFKRSFSTIYADTLDGEEAWWLPSWQNNLYLYFINSKKLFRYNSLNINGQKLKREFAFLRFAIKDKNGKIWIGSNNEGCYVIENYKKGITINYNADTGNVRLPTNKIYSGVLDKNGELWLIAHTAGVIHVKLYGLGEPQFELYDTRHGLD
jgi:ligand-binding sensor domain-containing protein